MGKRVLFVTFLLPFLINCFYFCFSTETFAYNSSLLGLCNALIGTYKILLHFLKALRSRLSFHHRTCIVHSSFTSCHGTLSLSLPSGAEEGGLWS